MTKVKTLFTQSVSLLQNTLSPKESVEYLLGFVLQCNPKDVYLYFEQKLSEEKKNVLQNLVQRRMYKEPVPYILNRTSFYQLDFYVDTSVLIPRVETELLVDLIIQKIQHQDLSQKVLWDIGTGSGCIGISLKKKFPQLRVICSDICAKALQVAKKNAKRHGVSIEFLLGDFLTPFQGLTFDFLVSNPPYVSQKEWETLDTDVKAFEPKKALIAQEEGLFYYQNFAQHLSSYQNSSSKVFFEMGHEQKKEIEKIFFTSGYKKMQFLKDYQGKDRFFLLEIE